MKKMIALLLAMSMCFALVACGNTEKPNTDVDKPNVEAPVDSNKPAEDNTPTDGPTVGEGDVLTPPVEGGEQPVEPPVEGGENADMTIAKTLLEEFKAKAGTMSAEELANVLVTNEVIEFMGGAVPVEPGYLTGFNEEITGFKSGVMFAPMIGTIPFVGYIFEMEEGANSAEFEQMLKDQANLRWNICTAADEMIVQSMDTTVFFIMAPYSMESEAPVEGEVPVEGEAPVEGEVEVNPVEGEVNTEGDTTTPVEGEATIPAEGEVTAPTEGEVATPAA